MAEGKEFEQDIDEISSSNNNLSEEVENDYSGGYLKDGLYPKEVIDDLLESYAPRWKLTYVDPALVSKARSYDFSSTNLYEALSQVAQAVNGIFLYDSYKYEMELWYQKNVGHNSGFRISERKYLKSMSQSLDMSNVITRLHCYGKDGISINSVNPIGTDYIEDYSYFFGDFEQDEDGKVIKHSDWMSDSLIISLNKFNIFLQDVQPRFSLLLKEQEEINIKINPLDIQLTEADAKLKSAQALVDIEQTALSQDQERIEAAQSEEKGAQLLVDELNEMIGELKLQLEDVAKEIATLKNTLSKDKHFTQEQLFELEEYVCEDTFSSEDHIDPVELYEDAYNKVFLDAHIPQETIDVSMANIYQILNNKPEWDKLNLGDKFIVSFERFGVEQEQQLLEINIGAHKEGEINLTIANTDKLYRDENKMADIMKNIISATRTVSSNKGDIGSIHDTRNEVQKLMTSNLDAAKNSILAGADQTVTIDNRGLTIVSAERPLEIVRATNGAIGLSRDGWNTVATAITAAGITAEQLIGRILIGQELLIQSGDDDGATFKMNAEGFQISNSALRILNNKDSTSNGIELSPEEGLVVTRADDQFRGTFNSEGIVFQAKKGSTYRNVFFYDSVDQVLSMVGGIDASWFKINGTNALSEDGTKIDANMIDTSAFDIQPLSWKSLPLRTGFTAGKILPQVAQEGSKVYLRGTVKKSPVATMSTPITFAATSPFYGIDVSNNNGSINWSQVSKDSLGIKFMVAKATEGSTFIDSYFKNHIVQAQANGIKGHAYHYMLATSNAAAISEANNFANVLDASGSNFSGYAFLDVEDNVLSGNATTLTGHCMAFLNRMKERGYKKIGIYASRSFYQTRLIASQFPSDMLLWIAAWGGSSAGITCDIWQYSETGRVSGISGGVDMNVGYSSNLLGNSNGGNTSPYPPSVILQSDRNAWDLYVFLLSKGYSKAAAAGVLGNVQGEVGSGMNPNTEQVRGPAYGIVQWDGSAYPLVGKKTWNGREYVQNLMKAAKITEDYTKMPTQVKLLDWCMFNGQWIGAVTPKSVSAFKSESSPSVAARAFELNFERPAASHPERQGWANTWFNKFKNLEIHSGGGGTIPPDPNPEGYIATLDSKYRPAVNQSFRLFPNDSVTVTTDGNVTPVSFTASEIDLSGITLFTK
ncbi:phage tail tip lysozyme [Brochothrix thermosphacta]|uniref:phage tail tip lysozyme n=1 Tax=Brochothrix thermosphacta TaxID=2756 RepID=UPI002713F81A|nr:phage tail tip lysozyme [Brochothrix thermosphacta]MDO7864906.1 phage tail tip lysozyme [Brochothrix thermosphacta]